MKYFPKSNKIIMGILLMMVLLIGPGKSVQAEMYTKPISEITFADFSKITCIHIGPDDVTIPSFHDEYVPSQMHNLVAFEVDEGNPVFSTYGGCLYNKEKTMLICFPQALRGAPIPSSCVNIMPQALKGTSRSIRKQVKAAITKNNGGKWPGYYRYVNDNTNTGKSGDN